MSVSFPIMVNATTIGNVEIVRQNLPPTADGQYTYHWVVIQYEVKTARDGSTCRYPSHISTGEVRHKYSDGAFVLIRKVMQEYEK